MQTFSCRFKLSSLIIISFVAFLIHSQKAFADVSGRWVCHFNLNGSGDYPQDLQLTESGGAVSGQELVTGTNNPFANITGSISGNSISMHMQYISSSYYADVVGSVSGSNMSGTWSNQGQAGGFTCIQTSTGGGGNPTPTPGATPTPLAQGSKRPTSIFIFCNRTGVGLSTADCSITVGDAGGPPRTTPTGAVNLTSTNGFFPSQASCLLQQTPYSPGVASCKAEFAIPLNFPIGIAFPIDATYVGDATFVGSSTSHATIQAGCIGDATNPCSGAVALSFADFPQILKNAITTVFECGNAKTTKSFEERGLTGDLAKCVGTITIDSKIGEILSKMDLNQINSLAQAISDRDARTDALLKALQSLDTPKNQLRFQQALNDQVKIDELLINLIKEQSDSAKNAIKNMKSLPRLLRAKKSTTLVVGSSSISVSNNSLKSIKVKLTKTALIFMKALKASGIGDVDADITIKGKRSSGPKKPFNKILPVNLGIN